jgi:hypothetical protein
LEARNGRRLAGATEGFIRSELGRPEITNPKHADANSHGSSGVRKKSRFSEMLIKPGVVLITKGDAVE